MHPGSPAKAIVLAGLTLATAAALYFALIDGLGFPDGHLTAYERWALPLRKAAVGALVALAVGVLGLAAGHSPARPRLLRAALVAAIALTLATLALLPAIGLHALQLEHGQGG